VERGETRRMDIFFNCQACGQHMVIDEAGAGIVIQCPKCGRDVGVPMAVASNPPPDTGSAKERTTALRWTPPTSPRETPKK
jgi:DNA-directed RNA polymerase subunit M/transcription elongation factor TFIIS